MPGQLALDDPLCITRPTSTSAQRSFTGTRAWHLAQIREQAQLGSGCIVGRGAYVGPGVIIGNNVEPQDYAVVYEPTRLGRGWYFAMWLTIWSKHSVRKSPNMISAIGR